MRGVKIAGSAFLAAFLLVGFQLVAAADPPGQEPVVRDAFIDFSKEHPGPPDFAQGGNGRGGGGGGGCTLPATDLCTDFKYAGVRWASSNVSYLVSTATPPSGVSAADARAAVQAAFDHWTNEYKSPNVASAYPTDGSNITFTYNSSTAPAISGPTFDGKNTVFFADISSQCGGCLAANWYWYSRATRQIVEFDIGVNTAYAWSASATGVAGKYDIEDVVTHEAGHALVLADLYKSGDAELTMYGYGSTGDIRARTLGAGDVLGVRSIYPA